MAAVQGFQTYFLGPAAGHPRPIHSFCTLPFYHVSGLMQFLRSFGSGGQLAIAPYRALLSELPHIDPHNFFLSLVPTQLQRLLAG